MVLHGTSVFGRLDGAESGDIIIMSNFTCEHCGTPIIDSAQGYATGCDHYPADFRLEHCPDCGKDIVADDDDACVCIQCGGRNRRVRYL